MISSISNYTSSIITLIITITIVELILPNNNNKKYVTFVSGLIIMLSVINPIVKIFNSNIDITGKIEDIQRQINENTYNSSTNYDLNYNLYNTYINNLKENMKNRFSEMGYEVLDAKVNVNEKFEPTEIEMKVKYDDGYVQPVIIDVFGNSSRFELAEADIIKIKNIISAEYGVNKEKIRVNE